MYKHNCQSLGRIDHRSIGILRGIGHRLHNAACRKDQGQFRPDDIRRGQHRIRCCLNKAYKARPTRSSKRTCRYRLLVCNSSLARTRLHTVRRTLDPPGHQRKAHCHNLDSRQRCCTVWSRIQWKSVHPNEGCSNDHSNPIGEWRNCHLMVRFSWASSRPISGQFDGCNLRNTNSNYFLCKLHDHSNQHGWHRYSKHHHCGQRCGSYNLVRHDFIDTHSKQSNDHSNTNSWWRNNHLVVRFSFAPSRSLSRFHNRCNQWNAFCSHLLCKLHHHSNQHRW